MRFSDWILRRRQEDRELEEELRFHLEQEMQLRMDRGEPADAARNHARLDFGNVTLAQEVTRQMWGWTAVETTMQDLRYAMRMLAKNRGFTILAVAALALGIGATSAVFTVVRSVLLRPLPFPDPDRLVMVWERQPTGRKNVVQAQNFLDWRSRNHSFEDIAATVALPMNLDSGGEAVQLPGVRVTAGFFEILRTPPVLGRSIRPEDDVPGAPPVAVLGYGLWQRSFGGRADVIGQHISISGRPAEVIGIMPPEFALPTAPRAALFTPMRFDPAQTPRDGRNYTTVARLRKGVSLGQAEAEMEAIAAQTARERPRMNYRWSASVVPLLEQTIQNSRTILLVLMGAVLCVLLIACANVSNLLLIRASARRREMALRIALGSGRWRLLRQLLMESLLLSLTGAVAGFLTATWALPALIHSLPASFPLPRMSEISVDPGVLGFAIGIALVCGLFFGIVPGMQAGRGSLGEGLRQGGRSGTAGNRPLRNALVVAEIAVAMLLVIGAGLMMRSFLLLNGTDPGFRPEHLLTVKMTLFPPFQSFDELVARRRSMVAEMLEKIRALPQVSAASTIHILPMGGTNSGTGYNRADRPVPTPGTQGGEVSIVSDDYFRTMGIPMIAGREFNLRDRAGATAVAVLNQSAAQQFFPGENPIGKRMRVDWGPNNVVEIVGVSADIRHNSLDIAPYPCLFMPHAQQPSGFVSLVIRTSGQPMSLVAAVKDQIRAVSPSQGAAEIQSMQQVVADSVARPRVAMILFATFGALALTLACLGIYAVISYSVEQRTREMGIRLALGAAPGGIIRMIVTEGMLLAVIGIVIGVVAALGLTRYLTTLLYAIHPTDPAVYGAVSAVLAIAAAAGCFLPARRATHADPAAVLRDE